MLERTNQTRNGVSGGAACASACREQGATTPRVAQPVGGMAEKEGRDEVDYS
jgi:hypothetical protein